MRYLTGIAGLVASAALLGGCGFPGLFGSASSQSTGSVHAITTAQVSVSRAFRIPSASMEPTLRCAKPAPGCTGTADDLAVTRLTGSAGVRRGDIIVFGTPPKAATECGEGGVFVKRLIGLPGETVHEDAHGVIAIDGKPLAEPYVSAAARRLDTEHFRHTWHVARGGYFVLGDNRAESCDSRAWGSVPAHDVIGVVTQIVRGGATLPVRR